MYSRESLQQQLLLLLLLLLVTVGGLLETTRIAILQAEVLHAWMKRWTRQE